MHSRAMGHQYSTDQPTDGPAGATLTGGRPHQGTHLVPRDHHTSVGFRFVPLGRFGRALPTVPTLGSQVRAIQSRRSGAKATARTLLPRVGAVPLGADDATVGNGPQPRHKPQAPSSDPATLWTRASSPREPSAPAGGAGSSPWGLILLLTVALDLVRDCRRQRGIRQPRDRVHEHYQPTNQTHTHQTPGCLNDPSTVKSL